MQGIVWGRPDIGNIEYRSRMGQNIAITMDAAGQGMLPVRRVRFSCLVLFVMADVRTLRAPGDS
jgi:hypothetical protein